LGGKETAIREDAEKETKLKKAGRGVQTKREGGQIDL